MADKFEQLKEQSHPNLMSKSAMMAASGTRGSNELLFSEILTKVNNAKDKAKKIAVLKQYDHPSLRMIIKGSFDPSIPPAISMARLAITSLLFIFVCVPLPVCQTDNGK